MIRAHLVNTEVKYTKYSLVRYSDVFYVDMQHYLRMTKIMLCKYIENIYYVIKTRRKNKKD